MTIKKYFDGSQPTAERLDRALELIAALTGRIEVLEAKAGDGEDGERPPALPPSWAPLKRAASITGYSSSMLRKLNDGGRASWWQYRAGRIWIDLSHCPRR
jgi:hypothetical protein